MSYQELQFDSQKEYPSNKSLSLKGRYQANKDSNIIITGEKRSGKSWASIRLAEKIRETVFENPIPFDVRENLFFDPIAFMKKFHSTTNDVLILDEASESFDARTWWEISNRMMNSLLVREGYRKNIVLMTFPIVIDLDKRSRRLCSHHITIKGIDPIKEISYGKCYSFKINHLKGMVFPTSGEIMPFTKPTEENRINYERMKASWNQERNEENIKAMEKILGEEKMDSYRHLKGQDYILLFKRDVLSVEEFKEKMTSLRFDPMDIELIIKGVEKRKAELEEKLLKEKFDQEEREKQKLLIRDFSPPKQDDSWLPANWRI